MAMNLPDSPKVREHFDEQGHIDVATQHRCLPKQQPLGNGEFIHHRPNDLLEPIR